MNGKKFSIIFPTRERTALLNELLHSIQERTAHIEDIEVLIAFDDDDEITKDYIHSLYDDMNFVKWVQCNRSLNFSRDYYTNLFKKSTGKWIIVINDDTKFMTKDWDISCDKVLNDFIKDGPNIVLGWVEDGLGAARQTKFGNYSCFPLLGREGVDLLGYIFPDDIPTWGADIWVNSLYTMLGRTVKVPLEILHICSHNGLREVDEVHRRIQKNQVGFDMTPRKQEIIKFKETLRNAGL